jgi:hypothetical protein
MTGYHPKSRNRDILSMFEKLANDYIHSWHAPGIKDTICALLC